MSSPVIIQMQSLIEKWTEVADPRAIFLSCYRMMTLNMLTAIERGEFQDPSWVDRLLHRFADYYFEALEAYDRASELAPLAWQQAHNLTRETSILPIQKLLLGVNAHINYDLVLTLCELLRPEWVSLSNSRRAIRYNDHCRVNEIIARTIDAVQDQVLEPAQPFMDLIDQLLGPLDELLISRMITHWRERVWQNAVRLLEIQDPYEQAHFLESIEKDALDIGAMIGLKKQLRGAQSDAGPNRYATST